jgi:FkbM family methyltransferase
MGVDLYRRFPVFRNEVDRCAVLLEPELGFDIREVVFAAPPEPASAGLDLRRMLGRDEKPPSAAEERLNRTSCAQPALFVIEYALAKLWHSWGARPEVMIGYSLGEYVAACLAGVLSLQDSLRLVARRAQLIETLPEGRMLAVMLPEAAVTELLGAELSLSAVNGEEFCVVAGPVEAVGELEMRLAADGVVTRRVRSSHAFHSRQMTPIADQVTALARGLTLRPPRIPYVSNVTGELITDDEATDPAYWARHLCSPVRFATGLESLGEGRVLLETGPGQSLSSIASAAPVAASSVLLASMRHAFEPQADSAVLLRTLGRLWLAGAELDPGRLPTATLGELRETAPEAAEERALTDTERTLTGIWVKLLRTDVLSPDVSFFELGGNSLVATRLLLRVTRAFGVDLTLRQVYERPTVAKLAALVDAVREGLDEPAAPAPTAVTAPVGAKPLFGLPNGLSVVHQNEAETLHFYEDIFDHRSYAKHGIRIPDGATVFDVGGNIGLFTLFAHYEANDVTVYTFEPAPPMFELISRNVAEHGVRAHLFNIGVSDAEGEASFTFYPRSAGMSSFHPDEAEEKHNLKVIMANQHRGKPSAEIERLTQDATELLDLRLESIPFTARLRPLSAIIREQGIERVDLLKVDVQKAELEVVNGIDAADWPKIRNVVLEAHDSDNRVARLCDLLRGHGFTVTAEQDELYVGTDIHLIYATRAGN